MFNFGEYTVESVTSGHPDKVCDQISDAILDACLMEDKKSRVAVETFGSHGNLIIGGEITTGAQFDAAKIARDLYRDIGYGDELDIQVKLVRQSPDIAQGVDTGGAGDQGIMYGYATGETPEYLPSAVVLAHRLTRGLEELRKSGKISWLGPDGKAQITIADGKVRTILVSAQHSPEISQEEIRRALKEELILPQIGAASEGAEIFINPTGKFEIGGFAADTGLTGRKIMVDSYGGIVPQGGGAFSGKDPTKVDRSAAYMARFAAKNIVANGLASQCLISVAYAIGRVEPLMLHAVDENNNSLDDVLKKNFDFRPRAIIERLNLLRPIYLQTASYGHFGRPGFSWEEIIKF